MRDGPSGWLITVAADYAVRGAIDDALVAAATAAEVGLVQVASDGTVWWSDETYRLHGRPRWRRVRTLDDLGWGVPADVENRLRATYAAALDNPDVELRYTATGEADVPRDLVFRALDHGLAVVHRAAPATAPVASAPRAPAVIDIRDTAVAPDREASDTAVVPAPEPAPAVGPAPVAADVEPVTDEPETVVPERSIEDVEPVTDEPPSVGVDLASAVLSATPDLVLLYDLDHHSVVTMAGNAPDTEVVIAHLRQGNSLREEIHPDDVVALVQWRDELAALIPGEVRHTDARFLIDGDWRWFEVRASEFRRDDDAVNEVVLVVRDVHQRIEAGRRVLESERAFREVFDASPVGLAVLDDHGRFTDVNDAFCTLAGRTREAVLATVYEALLHPEDRAAAVISRARRMTEGTLTTSSERRLARADGVMIWVRVRTSDIDYGADVRTLVSLEDVTSAKATEDQLRHDALHDDLTGLPNRRLIIDRLERALSRARRSGTRLALFFIDLDDLKRVNDTHPWQHRAGDVLLTSTAVAVHDTLREADTLGRLGGDEFIAICEDIGEDSTVADIGDRILQAVRRPLTIGSETVLVGASIGVAVTDEEEETAEQLLRRADSAMYAAKSVGGSRVVRSDGVAVDVAEQLDVAGALARRELRLHYQPVVSLDSGAVLGVTTVVRWRHPDRGLLPAEEVRSAIVSGAGSLPVIHWALERAIADVRTVAPTRVDHVSVWMPIPGRAALAPSTRTAMVTAFAGPDGSLGPDSAPSLVLDVHEEDVALLTRRRSLHSHLDELMSAGPLALGVEHFTADLVPVGMLQLISAASVSLDPELLAAAAENRSTEELVRALVLAASALGVVTIAMGIESHVQLEVARGLGIHAAYGDLIGPPAPLDTYSDLLHGGRMTLPQPPVRPIDLTDGVVHPPDSSGEETLLEVGADGPVGGQPTDVGPTDEEIWAQLMAPRGDDEDTARTSQSPRPTGLPRPADDDAASDDAGSDDAATDDAATPTLEPGRPPARPSRLPGLRSDGPTARPMPTPSGPRPAVPRPAVTEPTAEPTPTAEPLRPAPAPAVVEPAPAPAPAAAPAPTRRLILGSIGESLARELGLEFTPIEDDAPARQTPVDENPIASAIAESLTASPTDDGGLPPAPRIVLRPSDPGSPGH